jgi:hypothetical protein
VILREKLDAVRSQLQASQAQSTLERAELKSALDSAEEKLRQLSGLEQQLGSIITDAAAAGADVQPFTDVLQAAALGSKGRVAQVMITGLLFTFVIFGLVLIGMQHLALTRKMVEISRENEVLKRRAADSDAAAAAACSELEGLRYAGS